jgi:hypothetical protein
MVRSLALLGLPLLLPVALSAQARSNQEERRQGPPQSFATINAVNVTALSNGVQIRIAADGILQYRDADTTGRQMRLSFPDARNGTGKNFINVNRYPVSHIQLTTPQNAVNGIGLQLTIFNFVDTEGAVTNTPDGQGVLFTIESDRTIESGHLHRGPF